MIILNKRLVAQQGLSQAQQDVIIALHEQKDEIYKEATETDDHQKLRQIATKLTELEFELQDAWGFPRDINYHMFWRCPKCECPKIDNLDAYPTGYYVRNMACPLHGANNEAV